MQPLLSICIPTYNRCIYLKQALDSIVSQSAFIGSDEIEVVISDNCSMDDTRQLIQPYLKRFNNKIIYNRNNENIFDRNVDKVLSLANGQFFKLVNDTIVMKEDSLHEMLSLVKKSILNKPILFFANGHAIQADRVMPYSSFESFLKATSYYVTWIGSFGIWNDDYCKIGDFNREVSLRLPHVGVLFRTFGWNRNSIIDNNAYFVSQVPEKKGGYDLIEVFGDNYFQLLQIPLERGDLSRNGYKRELRKTLFKFIIPWMTKIKKDPERYYFTTNGWEARLNKYFSTRVVKIAKIMINIRAASKVTTGKIRQILEKLKR